MTDSWFPKTQDFSNFFKSPTDSAGNDQEVRSVDKADTPTADTSKSGKEPEEITLFQEKLTHLSLLYDVPFSYLVPSENMLKLHELQFFWMNPNWVRSLLDGACSLGRNASIDYSCDTTFLKKIYNEAISQSVNVRRKLQCKERINGLDADAVCTGFLLRSPLVGHWRGLEFIAYSDLDGKNPLKALRIETLSPEILLGLFAGEIGRLDIKEPPEGFHYGFTRKEDGTLCKSLRNLDTGELLPDLKISIREDKNRVIHFSEVAADIKQSLFPESKEPANSAHIALEMIQNPYMIKVSRK